MSHLTLALPASAATARALGGAGRSRVAAMAQRLSKLGPDVTLLPSAHPGCLALQGTPEADVTGTLPIPPSAVLEALRTQDTAPLHAAALRAQLAKAAEHRAAERVQAANDARAADGTGATDAVDTVDAFDADRTATEIETETGQRVDGVPGTARREPREREATSGLPVSEAEGQDHVERPSKKLLSAKDWGRRRPETVPSSGVSSVSVKATEGDAVVHPGLQAAPGSPARRYACFWPVPLDTPNAHLAAVMDRLASRRTALRVSERG